MLLPERMLNQAKVHPGAVESVVRERFPPAAEEPDAPLMALGADSLDVRGLAEGLRAALGVDLDAAQLLSYSTLAALRDHLVASDLHHRLPGKDGRGA